MHLECCAAPLGTPCRRLRSPKFDPAHHTPPSAWPGRASLRHLGAITSFRRTLFVYAPCHCVANANEARRLGAAPRASTCHLLRPHARPFVQILYRRLCKQGGHRHYGDHKQRLVRCCCRCYWWQATRGLTSVLAANSLSSAPRSRPVPKSRRLTGGGSLCSCCAGNLPARRPHAPPLAAAVESPLDFRAALVRRRAEGWRISAVVIFLTTPPRTACAGGALITVPLRHRLRVCRAPGGVPPLTRPSTLSHATIRA